MARAIALLDPQVLQGLQLLLEHLLRLAHRHAAPVAPEPLLDLSVQRIANSQPNT